VQHRPTFAVESHELFPLAQIRHGFHVPEIRTHGGINGAVLNGGKLRLNKIEFLIRNCGNQELTAAMDITKSEENKHSLLRTKLDRSLVNIQNTHFDCIPKWLFLIDLHLN
jgi:hypothetical protein